MAVRVIKAMAEPAKMLRGVKYGRIDWKIIVEKGEEQLNALLGIYALPTSLWHAGHRRYSPSHMQSYALGFIVHLYRQWIIVCTTRFAKLG